MKPVLQLNDRLLRLMSPEDRALYGQVRGDKRAGLTAEESVRHGARRDEKRQHHILMNWLLRNQVPYDRSRMDRRVTSQIGWPDFKIIYGNQILLIEMKEPGCELSTEQKKTSEFLEQTGTDYHVSYSADEAIRLVSGWLRANWRWQPVPEKGKRL